MKKILLASIAALAVVGFGLSEANATTIAKDPDLGTYWGAISSIGTFVYADSFVASVTGSVANLGVWLQGGQSNYVLEVLADHNGNGPNGASVLAITDVQSGTYDSLSLASFATTSSQTLTAGTTYWFAVSTVELGGSGNYSVGGHTQNSEQIDNGTFWYSNDAAGLSFDGTDLTPEMAFTVTINDQAIPEPASMALLGAGVFGLGLIRRRRA